MGLILPEKCNRHLSDCSPLALIESENKESYICCGKNDGTTRVFSNDEYRLCWYSKYIDELSDLDRRDILDSISVLSQALSIDENMRVNDD